MSEAAKVDLADVDDEEIFEADVELSELLSLFPLFCW
jgi:hypothetical protein